MFVRYIWDVKNLVKDGWNDLEIQFQSPVEYAKKVKKRSTNLEEKKLLSVFIQTLPY